MVSGDVTILCVLHSQIFGLLNFTNKEQGITVLIFHALWRFASTQNNLFLKKLQSNSLCMDTGSLAQTMDAFKISIGPVRISTKGLGQKNLQTFHPQIEHCPSGCTLLSWRMKVKGVKRKDLFIWRDIKYFLSSFDYTSYVDSLNIFYCWKWQMDQTQVWQLSNVFFKAL